LRLEKKHKFLKDILKVNKKMPIARIELAPLIKEQILSLARLPIPPNRQKQNIKI